jgi:hypothetical protein
MRTEWVQNRHNSVHTLLLIMVQTSTEYSVPILYLFCTTSRVLAMPRCFLKMRFCTYSVDYYSVPILYLSNILYYSVPITYSVLFCTYHLFCTILYLSLILYYSVPITYSVLFCTYQLFCTYHIFCTSIYHNNHYQSLKFAR